MVRSSRAPIPPRSISVSMVRKATTDKVQRNEGNNDHRDYGE
jgi:hypothetical protein